MWFVMMINKYSYEKCDKHYNKANTRKSKHIEHMIHHLSKICIYSINSSNIKDCFYKKCNPEYFLVNNVENNKKCKIDEWKKEHMSIILSC